MTSIIFVTKNPSPKPQTPDTTNPKPTEDQESPEGETSNPLTIMAKQAPVRPAIRAWDSEEGRPKAQAKIPQATTPIMPADRPTRAFWALVEALAPVNSPKLTKPAMDSATPAARREKVKTPIKLKTAAMAMAFLGAIALVEMQVATALGASVQPLIKTTPRAKIIVITISGLCPRS